MNKDYYMQFIPVYLYPNKLELFTNSEADAWKTERYRQVYQKNLKIYKGADNRVDLQVRTSDQKTHNIQGSSLVFVLISKEDQRILLEKDCVEQDLSIGRAYVEIDEIDLYDLEPGLYQYSILKETRSNIDSTEHKVTKRTPVYLDSNYGVAGTLEIFGDIKGEPSPSLEISEFRQDVPEDFSQPYTYYSSIIDAKPEISTGSSLHTFQFYMTDYNGSVTIQGSLSKGGNPFNWIDIIDPIPVVGSDLKYKNIVGKYNFFRIKHIPNKVSAVAEFVVAQTILNEYTVSIRTGGRGYQLNDTITISGARLGGETPTNNLIITVTSVDENGAILTVTHQGLSYPGVKTFVLSGDNLETGTIDKILYR